MSKASSDQSLSLSAAGRKFQLGMMYNAYKHELFESLNLLEKCSDVGKRSRLCPSLSLELKSSYTINERLEAFRFGGHVKVGVSFGFFKLEGSASANYINDKSSSIGQARMTLDYKHIKRYEELDTETIQTLSGNYEVIKLARERGATHFVAGLTYGNRVLIDYKFTKRDEKEHDLVDIQLKGVLRLGQALADTFNKDEKRETNFDDIQCYFFCDSMDFKQAQDIYQKLPTTLQDDSNGMDFKQAQGINQNLSTTHQNDRNGMNFKQARGIYRNLQTILQDVEAVDSVYLLPLSIIDTNARRFKQSDIDEVTMQKLVYIRDDLYEQEMQCDEMEKRGINTSKIKDDIQQYTDKLKCMLSSTSVKSWSQEVIKHNSSDHEMHKFQQRLKEEFQLIKDRTCRICEKELATESELAQHMRDHEHKNKGLTCPVCKEEFSTESELEQHRRKQEVFRCSICEKEFSTKEEKSKHWWDHYVRTCYSCEKEFSTEEELEQHKREVKPRTCRMCSKEFSTESECAQHMRDAEARTCGRCNYEFSNESEFAQHMRDTGDYRCGKCDQKFCTEGLLSRHMRNYHARNCHRCEKEFSTEEELAQHISVDPIPCCKCNQKFCTENEFAEHIQIYHVSASSTS